MPHLGRPGVQPKALRYLRSESDDAGYNSVWPGSEPSHRRTPAGPVAGPGKGFIYLDNDGRRLAPTDIERCKRLVIPPAWEEVWICPVPNGHLQAVGTDDAGRRQYLYHEQWRIKRDKSKHDRVLTVAARLPRARRKVARHLELDGHAVRTGTRHRLPVARPGLLPDRRRGVRGDEQQLRAGHHPEAARHRRRWRGRLRLRREVRPGALRRPRRRPGPRRGPRPAPPPRRRTRSCWRTGTGGSGRT